MMASQAVECVRSHAVHDRATAWMKKAEPRQDRAQRIPAEIAVAEGLGDAAQAKCQDQLPNSPVLRDAPSALTQRLGAPPASAP